LVARCFSSSIFISTGSPLAAPTNRRFLLQLPSTWRLTLPIAEDVPDATAVSRDFVRMASSTVVAGIRDDEVSRVLLYKVHQRIAKAFSGRAGLSRRRCCPYQQ
jgi:hypothetical protein